MSALKDTRCAVLGAGGFLGTTLCQRLRGQTAALRAFGRRQSFPDALRGIEWLTGDFADIQHVKEAIHGCDTVFTSPTPRRRPVPTRTRSPICNPTSPRRWDYWMRAVTWASSALSSFRRAARSTVCPSRYPRRNPHPPCRLPRMAFPNCRSKNTWRSMSTCMASSIVYSGWPTPLVPTRRQSRVKAPSPPSCNAAWTTRRFKSGDGSVVRDYIYADDVIDALIQAVKHEGTSRVFNVGAGHGRSLLDIIQAIESVSGRSLAVEFLPKRDMDVPCSVLDTSLAAQELGWHAKTPFPEGIRQTWAWISNRHLIKHHS